MRFALIRLFFIFILFTSKKSFIQTVHREKHLPPIVINHSGHFRNHLTKHQSQNLPSRRSFHSAEPRRPLSNSPNMWITDLPEGSSSHKPREKHSGFVRPNSHIQRDLAPRQSENQKVPSRQFRRRPGSILEDVDFKTWKPAKVTPSLAVTKVSLIPTSTEKTSVPNGKVTGGNRPSSAATDRKSVLAEKSARVDPQTAQNGRARNKGHIQSQTSVNQKHTTQKIVVKEQGREGESLRLACPKSDPNSAASETNHFIWTTPEKLTLRPGKSGPRHTVQSNGGLVIESLNTVDEGPYLCSVIINNHTVPRGSVYVTIEDCSMAPCLNGGECEDLDGPNGSKLICRCLASFEGRYCEVKKNLYYLLVPLIGSGLIVMGIIAVVIKFTCFKPNKNGVASVPKQSSTTKPNDISTKPEKVDQREPLILDRKPFLPTTPSRSLPRYSVTQQYGEPAYWPDRRFSYTKMQDGAVTQTGQPADYPTSTRSHPQLNYAEEQTQTLPNSGQVRSKEFQSGQPVSINGGIHHDANADHRTSVPTYQRYQPRMTVQNDLGMYGAQNRGSTGSGRIS